MGIVRLPNIYHYWTTNGARFLVPFVRTTLSRKMFMMIRHYLHFADARKKVLRGDRSMPAPPGYDPIYNFHPSWMASTRRGRVQPLYHSTSRLMRR